MFRGLDYECVRITGVIGLVAQKNRFSGLVEGKFQMGGWSKRPHKQDANQDHGPRLTRRIPDIQGRCQGRRRWQTDV
jgi:hypothetical protein